MEHPNPSARKKPASIGSFSALAAALPARAAFDGAPPSAGNPPFRPPGVPDKFKLMMDEVRLPYVTTLPEPMAATVGPL